MRLYVTRIRGAANVTRIRGTETHNDPDEYAVQDYTRARIRRNSERRYKIFTRTGETIRGPVDPKGRERACLTPGESIGV